MKVLDIPEQLELWFGKDIFCLVVDSVSRLLRQTDQRNAPMAKNKILNLNRNCYEEK